MRDIKSYVRAMSKHCRGLSLKDKVDEAIVDLNYIRPRPVLDGRTAHEVFTDRRKLPSRQQLGKEVDRKEKERYDKAESNRERDNARRDAICAVLSRYGLLEEIGDVSTDLAA